MADEECANPLLLGWITEWLDQARERGSKGITVYKKAYNSMKACPLVFNHPSEAQQLNGLGQKLCDNLTEKLRQHCAENGLPMPEPPQKGSKRAAKEADNPSTSREPKKPKKAKKPYVPTLRSGPYALVVGLSTLDEDSSTGLTKAELIEIAQQHCDSSFTAPMDTSKFYTAWNSMKTLVQKDLVYEHGRPTRRYLLTEEGWETARRIRSTMTEESVSQSRPPGPDEEPERFETRETSQQRVQHTRPSSSTSRNFSERNYIRRGPSPPEILDLSEDPPPGHPPGAARAGESPAPGPIHTNPVGASTASSVKPITLPPGSFTVELVLDVREIRSTKDREYISNELTRKGITPIVRSLELGDCLWVAKCRDPNFLSRYGEQGDEVMLDWIVERKRLDDLIGSIKDGRFREQKFRLRRSGVKHVTYLIEEFSVADSTGSGSHYQESVASAIASTQVVNEYFVKKTQNLDDTIRYLARMTTLLRKMYTGSSPSTASTPQSNISIIPTKSIDSLQTYLDLLDKFRSGQHGTATTTTATSTTYTSTFTTFSSLSSKSEMLSLRDLFLKMLMCTRGVTGDKAVEIQRRWRTPRQFIEAFEELHRKNGNGSSGARKVALEDMVAVELGGLVGRKKIGKVLSKRIAEVWGPQR